MSAAFCVYQKHEKAAQTVLAKNEKEKKKENTMVEIFVCCCGGGIRTPDFKVMSLAR